MLIISLLSLGAIFIVNLLVGLYYGFGKRYYWFYEVLHFLGGFFVAMFLYNFTRSWHTIYLGLAGVSFIWESAEYSLVRVPTFTKQFKRTFHTKPEYKLGDTILDLLLNFAGATIFLLLFT